MSWSVQMASGGRPSVFQASSSCLFSTDGKFSIVILSHQIRVYFLSTRQCTKSIDFDSTSVVDAFLDPADADILILVAQNGTFNAINWKDDSVAWTKNIDLEVSSVISVQKDGFYVLSGPNVVKITRDFEVLAVLSAEDVINTAVSNDRQKIVFLTSDHQLITYNFSVLYGNELTPALVEQVEATRETLTFPYKSPIVSLAISNDFTIALGSVSGAIQMVYGQMVNQAHRVLKWHVDPVKSLCFTPDNVYLLSGGNEKVLVFWHLELDKTQFLPRLNGPIGRIAVDTNKDDHYVLELEQNGVASQRQVVVISAVDLVSRLAVAGANAGFSVDVSAQLARTARRAAKSKDFNLAKIKHNYTAPFEVHSGTNMAYFPAGSAVQAFDVVRNEQAFVQNVALTLSTGKVRSEAQLTDPKVSLVAFTGDGKWMATFDTVETSDLDQLLSKNDRQYALKFWKYVEASGGSAHASAGARWELATKVIDPHGAGAAVGVLRAAPAAYHEGIAFLTVDRLGGARVWRPRIPKEIYRQQATRGQQQLTAWTVRRARAGGAVALDSVDACWSADGSLAIIAHDTSIHTVSTTTFDDHTFTVPALAGGAIRSVDLVGSTLVVVSQTRVVTFDLLTGRPGALAARLLGAPGTRNLVAVDVARSLVAIASNYYERDGSSGLSLRAKISVFSPDAVDPVATHVHPQAITAVRSLGGPGFIFADTDARLGLVVPPTTAATETAETAETDLVASMSKMLLRAQASADLANSTAAPATASQSAPVGEHTLESTRTVDVATFASVFENAEGVHPATLFDRIIKVIK